MVCCSVHRRGGVLTWDSFYRKYNLKIQLIVINFKNQEIRDKDAKLKMTSRELPKDVISFIQSSFSPEKCKEALSILSQSQIEDGSMPSPRLLRCVAFACSGNLPRLQRLASLLAVDWREVIMAGEYELRNKEAVQIRNFNEAMKV